MTSRDAIERRLARHLAAARATCPSLAAKHMTMHTLRHTAAVRLLLAGNDVTVIALWLGHEQAVQHQRLPTHRHDQKQQAIDRTTPIAAKPGVTGPPTPSSPSSKASEYADESLAPHHSEQDLLVEVGITPRSA